MFTVHPSTICTQKQQNGRNNWNSSISIQYCIKSNLVLFCSHYINILELSSLRLLGAQTQSWVWVYGHVYIRISLCNYLNYWVNYFALCNWKFKEMLLVQPSLLNYAHVQCSWINIEEHSLQIPIYLENLLKSKILHAH